MRTAAVVTARNCRGGQDGAYVDSDEVIEIGELLIFANPDLIVVVRHGEGRLDGVRERIERRPDLPRHGSAMALYSILDHVVDGYEEAAGGVDVDIQQVERQVFSGDRSNRQLPRAARQCSSATPRSS